MHTRCSQKAMPSGLSGRVRPGLPQFQTPTSGLIMYVNLRNTTMQDLPNIMTWVNDKEINYYFANRQKEISEADEVYYLNKLLQSKTDWTYSIYVSNSPPPLEGTRIPEYAGQCSINQIYEPAANGRMFIVLKKEFQGMGIGQLAIKELLVKAIEGDLHKIWLIVREDNKRAQALYLRAGFSFEGVLKDEYKIHGKYVNMVRMGIIL